MIFSLRNTTVVFFVFMTIFKKIACFFTKKYYIFTGIITFKQEVLGALYNKQFIRKIQVLLLIFLIISTSLTSYLIKGYHSGYADIVNNPLINPISKLNLKPGINQELNPLIRAMEFSPKDPLHLKFYFDKKINRNLPHKDLQRIIKYFLAFLAIPSDKVWVNLSPYEKGKIMPEVLEKLDIGKDLLIQDLLLKQLVSYYISPETDSGKKFWQYITCQIDKSSCSNNSVMGIFNKVWIVPDKALVCEAKHNDNNSLAFIKEARLKVMIDDNCLSGVKLSDRRINQKIKEAFKHKILPLIEEEVNKGRTFIVLRQLYYSLILAYYFKNKMNSQENFRKYIDREKISPLQISNNNFQECIYKSYLNSFAYKNNCINFSGRNLKPYFTGGVKAIKGEKFIVNEIVNNKLEPSINLDDKQSVVLDLQEESDTVDQDSMTPGMKDDQDSGMPISKDAENKAGGIFISTDILSLQQKEDKIALEFIIILENDIDDVNKFKIDIAIGKELDNKTEWLHESIDDPKIALIQKRVSPSGKCSYKFKYEKKLEPASYQISLRVKLDGIKGWQRIGEKGKDKAIKDIGIDIFSPLKPDTNPENWVINKKLEVNKDKFVNIKDKFFVLSEIAQLMATKLTRDDLAKYLRIFTGDQTISPNDFTGVMDLEYLARGMEKITFKVKVYLKGRVKGIPFIIKKTHDKSKLNREWQDLYAAAGENAPLIGPVFESKYCYWISQEFIFGNTASKLDGEGKLFIYIKKMIIETILRFAFKIKSLYHLGNNVIEDYGSVPRDLKLQNFIIEEGKDRIVFIDFGENRLHILGDKYSLDDRLLFIASLLVHYGDCRMPESNWFIFDMICDYLKKQKGSISGREFLNSVLNYSVKQNDKGKLLCLLLDKGDDLFFGVDKTTSRIDKSFPEILIKSLTTYLENSQERTIDGQIKERETIRGDLEEILKKGKRPLIVTDMDDTLIKYDYPLDDNTAQQIIEYLEAGGVLAIDTLANKDWFYYRFLSILINSLSRQNKLYLLSNFYFIISRVLEGSGEDNLGGTEVYMYDPQVGGFRLAFHQINNDKADGVLRLLWFLNKRGDNVDLLGYWGDNFSNNKNDGSVLDKSWIRLVMNVGKDVFVERSDKQNFINAQIKGPQTTLRNLNDVTDCLKKKEELRILPYKKIDSYKIIPWTFALKNAITPVEKNSQVLVRVNAPGFVWTGSRGWLKIYLIPLVKKKEYYEALLPSDTDEFTFFWQNSNYSVGSKFPGNWEGQGVNFYLHRQEEEFVIDKDNPKYKNLIEISASVSDNIDFQTALVLAIIENRPILIKNIGMTKSSSGGLCQRDAILINFLGEISKAEVLGAKQGSRQFLFIPQKISGGHFVLDLDKLEGMGIDLSSIGDILWVVIAPLLYADKNSTVIVKGGTHFGRHISIEQVKDIFLPLLSKLETQNDTDQRSMGAEVKMEILRYGLEGMGGEIALYIEPIKKQGLNALRIGNRGYLQDVKIKILTSGYSHKYLENKYRLVIEERIRDKIKISPDKIKFECSNIDNCLLGEYRINLFIELNYGYNKVGFSTVIQYESDFFSKLNDLLYEACVHSCSLGALDLPTTQQILVFMALAAAKYLEAKESVVIIPQTDMPEHISIINAIENILPVEFTMIKASEERGKEMMIKVKRKKDKNLKEEYISKNKGGIDFNLSPNKVNIIEPSALLASNNFKGFSFKITQDHKKNSCFANITYLFFRYFVLAS